MIVDVTAGIDAGVGVGGGVMASLMSWATAIETAKRIISSMTVVTFCLVMVWSLVYIKEDAACCVPTSLASKAKG